MKTPQGERLLTVKDIAECIAFDRSENGLARTLRQVQHWTQHDLLRPYSDKATGKGIPRFYVEDPTIDIAAILAELHRYGATVEILKPVSDALYEDDKEGGMYLGAALTERNSYLQVAWQSDPRTGAFIGAKIETFDDIDLNDEGPQWMVEVPSSILINMTRVIQRIYPLPWMGKNAEHDGDDE